MASCLQKPTALSPHISVIPHRSDAVYCFIDFFPFTNNPLIVFFHSAALHVNIFSCSFCRALISFSVHFFFLVKILKICFNWRIVIYNIVIITIHQHESATGIHVFPHPEPPPPTSLPTLSFWVVPEHLLWLPCFMHQTWTGHLFYIW